MAIDVTLYAIVDPAYSRGRALHELVISAMQGGATIVQLRAKQASVRILLEEAKIVGPVARELEVPLIVNDRVDVALASGAAGVHLGQGDLPCPEARRLLGSDKVVGISVHSLEEAREAEEEGADYISVGKIYPTKTKTDGRVVGFSTLREIAAEVRLPVVAIGGIHLGNLKEVFQAGASGIAVISGLLDTEDVRGRAEAFRKEITKLGRGRLLR